VCAYVMRPAVEAQICVKATLRLRYRSAHIVPMSFGRAKVSLSVINIILPVTLIKKRPLHRRAPRFSGDLHEDDTDLFICILLAIAHGQHGTLDESIDLGISIDSLCRGDTRAEFDLQRLAIHERDLTGLHAR
jgi:hypothetical protein